MAEFCLDCWNKINETRDSKWRYVQSWDRELCEECGQYKRVIIVERFWSRTQKTLSEMAETLEIHKDDRATARRASAFRWVRVPNLHTYAVEPKDDVTLVKILKYV